MPPLSPSISSFYFYSKLYAYSISVLLVTQIVCLSIHYSQKKVNILFGNCEGTFGGYYPCGPNAQKCFYFCRSPQGSYLKYFVPFAYCYFSMFLYFLRNIKLLNIKFFTNVPDITLLVTSLKKPLHSIYSFFRAYFQYLM